MAGEFQNLSVVLKDAYSSDFFIIEIIRRGLKEKWGEQIANIVCSSPLCDKPIKLQMMKELVLSDETPAAHKASPPSLR